MKSLERRIERVGEWDVKWKRQASGWQVTRWTARSHLVSRARRPVFAEITEAALGRIHPRYAEAIRLRVLQEKPREEVAKALGATPATFDVVLHRAMAALRKVLGESGEGGSDG